MNSGKKEGRERGGGVTWERKILCKTTPKRPKRDREKRGNRGGTNAQKGK